MRYGEEDQESKNIEDRRGQRGSMGPEEAGGFSFPMGGGGMSITTMIIMALVALFFGGNITDILTGGGGGGAGAPSLPTQNRRFEPGPGRQASGAPQPYELPGLPSGGRQPGVPSSDEGRRFVGRVLKDTEDVWNQVFQSFGKNYEEPKLVMFTGSTPTACGRGQTAMGPFYCPVDRKVYIDLAFYEELKRRFHSPGDFAQAYVVAHEVGHHVQTLLGIADKVQQMKERASERQANAIQVRMELQADCLAGVWAHVTQQLKGRLEKGDIESGLNAASQIGDDMIQREATGRVMPDRFTHGSSAQRVGWFRKGIESGQIQACDTFNQADPQ